MYRCMQQLNKIRSTRAVDAHTGTVYIQRGTTRGEGEERREKGRETRGKENPQTQAKNARTPQPTTGPGGGGARGGRREEGGGMEAEREGKREEENIVKSKEEKIAKK